MLGNCVRRFTLGSKAGRVHYAASRSRTPANVCLDLRQRNSADPVSALFQQGGPFVERLGGLRAIVSGTMSLTTRSATATKFVDMLAAREEPGA